MEGKQLYFFNLNKNTEKTDSQATIVLSLDKIILLGVITLILLMVSFSFGVEKGKRITLVSLQQKTEENKLNTTSKINISEQQEPVEQQLAAPQELPQPSVMDNTEKTIKTDIDENKNIAKYYIQVASFQKENSAKEEANILKTKGYPVIIAKKGNYIVVYVGNFNDEKEAKHKLQILKERYKDCILRRL
ncbi:MAG: SPOR domain-containing protein [Candidatus Omnitrophica bacterium]|jgi:cell division protein FtsN|nr:SPOR domain-containing protein [Candidatus Omnitrophota bacterium]